MKLRKDKVDQSDLNQDLDCGMSYHVQDHAPHIYHSPKGSNLIEVERHRSIVSWAIRRQHLQWARQEGRYFEARLLRATPKDTQSVTPVLLPCTFGMAQRGRTAKRTSLNLGNPT